MGRIPLHPAAQAAPRPNHRHPSPLHGFVHDLYGGDCFDRRRSRQLDDVSLNRSRQDRPRSVRPRTGRRHVPHLLPDHPPLQLAVLHARHAQRGEVTMSTTSAISATTVASAQSVSQRRAFRARSLAPIAYIVFLLLPIYWLLNMSFKTTNEIMRGFTLWPHAFTI